MEGLWGAEGEPSVVDEDGDRAGGFDDGGYGGQDGGAGADVAGAGVHGELGGTCIAELGGERGKLVFGAGEEDQSASFAGKCFCDGGANAERGTCD